MQPRIRRPDSHQCERCRKLIAWLLKPGVGVDDPAEVVDVKGMFRFGTVRNLRGSSCSLELLFPQLYDRYLADAQLGDEHVQCALAASPDDLFGERAPTGLGGLRRSWAVEVVFRSTSSASAGKRMELAALRVRLVADSVAVDNLGTDTLLNLGREIDPRSYDNWVLSGLSACLHQHGSRCRVGTGGISERLPPPPTPQGPLRGLRLIDVSANNVVDAPEACEYIALSYVWGHTNSLLLLKNTRDDLYAPGGLARFNIPQTIADAIEVVRQLGQQYLWVDALCIQQDDAADKALQILRMDSVYCRAIATIVAANGDHADSGLCGMSPRCPRRPQIVSEAQGFRFAAASPPLSDLLGRGISRKTISPWGTRAWTYQEYRLSRRLLIFSQDNVIWKCGRSELHEDWVGEMRSDRTEVPVEDKGNRSTIEQVSAHAGGLRDYPQLVSQYGARHMTYESDGLNAISSILSAYGSAIRDGMVCGIPVSTLMEQGLMWFPSWASPRFRRRQNTTLGPPFPSWSWVGWVGPVWHGEFWERPSEVKAGARVIDSWVLEHTSGSLESTALHFPAAPSPMSRQQGYEGCLNEDLKAIQTGTLCFETEVSRFSVDTKPWAQFGGSQDTECAWTGLYKVFSGHLWVGTVHLVHETRNELAEGSEGDGLHTFIAVSQSVDADDDVWEIEENIFDADADPDWVKPYDVALEGDDGGHVFNTLLVSGGQPDYSRQGLAQVHRASWMRSALGKERVRLA